MTARAEVERLTAMVRRVRELHRESRGSMSALYPNPICECGKDYPCPTIRALDANAKALNDVLPREALRQKAEAWDEGYRLGESDAAVNAVRVDGQHVQSINPYRTRED